MAEAIMGEAIKIADIRKNKLYVDTVAFDKIIDKVDQFPMSVVSVNGPMRSGKSYIIGHFLKYLSDPDKEDWFTKKLNKRFHWKNSSVRQTTGILMWSEPFFITRNGKKIAILLMDTQGCFDEKTTCQENLAIFALSCLLSSVLIYNVKNLLTEDTFQNLQMFIGYAKIPNDFSQSESKDSEPFTNLVFLIRDWECPDDFNFGYYDDITSSGPKNFKKEKIDATYDTHPENVTVRKAILKSFENVGCCLMPHPGKELARYDKEEHLDSDFVRTIKDFIPRIFEASNICLKKIDGKEISGNDFKQIVQKWAECFKQYDFPTIENAAEAQAKFQNQKAESIAILHYREKMSNEVKSKEGLSEIMFEKLHIETKKEAIKAFNRQPRIKIDDIQNEYMKKLEDEIKEAFNVYQEMNYIIRTAHESGERSKEEIKQLKEEMANKMKELARSQEARFNMWTIYQPDVYFTVKFVNEIDSDITLKWTHHIWGPEEFVIGSKVTKTFSFKNIDNLFWRTTYKATIYYNDNIADFCAFGNSAPRENNTFTIKSDGVFLRDEKQSNWVPIDTALKITSPLDSSLSEFSNLATMGQYLLDHRQNITELVASLGGLTALSALKSQFYSVLE